MAHRLKLNIIMTKRQIVTTKISPYFKDKSVCNISATASQQNLAEGVSELIGLCIFTLTHNKVSTINNGESAVNSLWRE